VALVHFFVGDTISNQSDRCRSKQLLPICAPTKAPMSSRPSRKSAARAQEAIKRDHERRQQLSNEEREQEDSDHADEHWEPGQPLHGDEPDSRESSEDDEDDEMDTEDDE